MKWNAIKIDWNCEKYLNRWDNNGEQSPKTATHKIIAKTVRTPDKVFMMYVFFNARFTEK